MDADAEVEKREIKKIKQKKETKLENITKIGTLLTRIYFICL